MKAWQVLCQRLKSHLTRLNDEKYLNDWKIHPVFHSLKKHVASTDTTSEVAELGTAILDFAEPNYVGRDLVALRMTTEEEYKERLPEIGKAQKTERGVLSIQSLGSRSTFVTVKVDDEIECNDEYDRKALEDQEGYVTLDQVRGQTSALRKLETEVIFDKLKDIRASGTAGHIAKTGANNDPSLDILTDLVTKIKSKDRMPNTIVMDPNSWGAILKTQDAKEAGLNTYYPGGVINYNTGHIGDYMGCKILTTTLCPTDTIYALDSNVVLLYVLRRDFLPMPWMDSKNDVFGFRISCRYGLEAGRKDGLAWWGAA